MKKSPDGRYHKYLRYEGRRYHLAANTERELMAAYGKLLHELETGAYVLDQNTTVERWSEEWLETYKRGKMTDKSFQTYREKLDGYILPEIGKMRLKDVTAVHLQKLLNSQAGRSFSHVSKLRMVICGLFRKAVSARLIVYDPAADLQLPAYTKGTHRSLTDCERVALVSLAQEGARGGLWALTMMSCGLRNGETRALLWKDVDLKTKLIHVGQAMEGGTSRRKAPKTAAGMRDVPIPPLLLSLLTQERKKASPFAPVFPQTDGITPHTERSLNGMWRSFNRRLDIRMAETKLTAAAQAASIRERDKLLETLEPDIHMTEVIARLERGNTGATWRGKVIIHGEPRQLLEELTPYCLRHTYGTDLQRAGVPLNVAKGLLGHTDIAMTANVYTHTTPDVIEQAADRLAALAQLGT